MTIRLAIIGAGFMARRRTNAFLATKQVVLCGVASRHKSSAEAFGSEFGIKHCFDDYHNILELKPDAVLIEVPHSVQDEIVNWTLSAKLHVFIGGPLSLTSQGGQKINELAQKHKLIVEAGFEARYKPVWQKAKTIINQREIGKIVSLRSVAFWDANKDSWYYRESLSGGMPLTHLTYAFLNPVRWLFGEPIYVSAFANQISNKQPDSVKEETCIANLVFDKDIIANLTSGYVNSGNDESWMISILGTEGVLEIYPTEMDKGNLRVFHGDIVTNLDFADDEDPFIIQAKAFIESLTGNNCCRNTPSETLGDLYAIEAIVKSAHEYQTIKL